jgi:spore cortex biosynthesis protein YabQ
MPPCRCPGGILLVLKVELQFYSMFMVILSGMAVGLLYDLLRVGRIYYELGAITGAVADLCFWILSGLSLAAGLFHGNWGDARLYVLIGLILGLGIYLYLASPTISEFVWQLLRFLDWLWGLLFWLVKRLIWQPLLWLATWLYVGGRSILLGLWKVLLWIGAWLFRPLIRGPYRWCRLRYLLTKRRLKRWLRHRFVGPRR